MMTDKTTELRSLIRQGKFLVVKDNAFVLFKTVESETIAHLGDYEKDLELYSEQTLSDDGMETDDDSIRQSRTSLR